MANRKLRNRKRIERPKLSQVTQSLPPNIEIEALIGQSLDGPKEFISNGLKVWGSKYIDISTPVRRV
jgi:hypothetical protein